MIRISAGNEDYDFFETLQNKYDGIDLVTGKELDGSADIVEVIIQLTPSILPFLALILHEIISYMKEKRRQETKEKTANPSKITVEKKTGSGKFKIIIESDQIDDVDTTVNNTIKQIKKM